jgi:hypothetical protein
MSDGFGSAHAWRQDVDLEAVQSAQDELCPLLRAVAATGASMLIKIDGERTEGVNPKVFTVVISGIGGEAGSIRFDEADLGRASDRAVQAFDARH